MGLLKMNDDVSKILIISEGEDPEKYFIQSMQKCFFPDDDLIFANLYIYETSIYDLHKNITDFVCQRKLESFEDDKTRVTIAVLKERINKSLKKRKVQPSENDKKLLGISANKISEIYLFFDADLHNGLKENLLSEGNKKILSNNLKKLSKMIDFFSEEMEYGKLYISYPMVEALWDLSKFNNCGSRCCTDILLKVDYKKDVRQKQKDFLRIENFNKDVWDFFCSNAILKGNCVINNSYTKCDYKKGITDLTQKNIFEKEQLLVLEGKVYVLSGFPFFLLEYHKEEYWNNLEVPSGYKLEKAEVCPLK